ncbi:MAG: hypothetical protein WCD30_15540 [Pseudolabrys sp.]
MIDKRLRKDCTCRPTPPCGRNSCSRVRRNKADYHAFCTALSESARGRAFLAEYARRNRNADTRPLLSAIERLQISLAADPAEPAEVLIKQKLRALLDDITLAQTEIEASVMGRAQAR